MRQLLGFMGIADVTIIRAEKIGYGPDARAASIADAVQTIATITVAANAAWVGAIDSTKPLWHLPLLSCGGL